MSQPSGIDDVISRNTGNAAVRAVMQAFTLQVGPVPVPVGALLDNLMSGRRDRLRERNLSAFIEEIGKRHSTITPERLDNDNGLVYAIVTTVDAASRVRRIEKARLFGVMLANYDAINVGSDADEYEQMQHVLDDISLREYQALLILRALENRHPYTDGLNVAQHTGQFWNEYTHRLVQKGISKEELLGFFGRLARTGLFETYAGRFLDVGGGEGQTSVMFDKFLAALSRHRKEHPQKHRHI